MKPFTHTEAALHIYSEIDAIEIEIHMINAAEGIDNDVRATGTIKMHRGAAWYEIKDRHNTISWVSRSYPRQAAHGETLVYADSEEIFSDFE